MQGACLGLRIRGRLESPAEKNLKGWTRTGMWKRRERVSGKKKKKEYREERSMAHLISLGMRGKNI